MCCFSPKIMLVERYDPIVYHQLGDVEKVSKSVTEAEIEQVGEIIAK